MKLQNMTVIFIIIAIPIILILSYYISLQIDTINMQTSYNSKLLSATKAAIEAFEINTVEWNDAYSSVANSKRRDVMASINTFTTSFANSTGVAGTSKENILSYMPAILFTLYDGYYIYTPSQVKQTVKDENGVTVFYKQKIVGTEADKAIREIYEPDNEGKILYEPANGIEEGTYYYNADGTSSTYTLNSDNAATEYKHILKPYTTYSARYKRENIDIVVDYTLDNYIKIYGTINGTDIIKSGYLINTDAVIVNNDSILNIRSENKEITKESLNETVCIGNSTQNYNYVYAEDNTKVYFDGTTPFQVSSNGVKTNLSDLSGVKYKKLLIKKTNTDYTEIYQALVSNDELGINAGSWYSIRNDKTSIINDLSIEYGMNVDLQDDVSAINYCVQSYCFSNWVKLKLLDIEVVDLFEVDDTAAYGNDDDKVFDIAGGEESNFYKIKREVIKQSIIKNLNQAITSYSRNSAGEYQLPVLSETDWDQILNNVSITTFVQGIPIGMKEYNNYAIATSTANKEYVDPNQIYLMGPNDKYYHKLNCSQFNDTGVIIGYRNIDYIKKSYKVDENTNYYYYKHSTAQATDTDGNLKDFNQECYYCLINNSLYQQDISNEQETAYQKALARERYVSHEFR